VLETAEALYRQFANSINIPDVLAELATQVVPPPHAQAQDMGPIETAAGESWVSVGSTTST
jgi:hypothetical protein